MIATAIETKLTRPIGIATSYPNGTDEFAYELKDRVFAEGTTTVTETDEKKQYINQCRMRLFQKLGAVLGWNYSYGVLGGNPFLRYWESAGSSPAPPQAPRFISCFLSRMCDNRGRHRNIVLNSGRRY